MDVPGLNSEVFGKHPPTKNLWGIYEDIYLGCSAHPEIKSKGSAGGVVTSLLIYALEKGEIDGAIVVGMDGLRPQPTIARTRDEVINSSQSKYTMVPLGSLFRRINLEEEHFALVGLPCHIHALRKARWISDKVRFVIGIFCGTNYYYTGTLAVLRKLGVRDLRDVERIEYRHGEYPSYFHVKLKDGEEHFIEKTRYTSLLYFYLRKRCLLCIDFSSELADISVGDAWLPYFRHGDPMWSMVITRTKVGKSLFKRAVEEGYVRSKRISEKEAFTAHSQNLQNKKRGAFIRIDLMRRMGAPTPIYHIPPMRFRFIETVWEALFMNAINFLTKKWVRISLVNLPFLIYRVHGVLRKALRMLGRAL